MSTMNDLGHGNVLVVDDDASVRRVLKRILTEEGYAVIEVVDGNEALETIARHDFEIILLDFEMPGISGIQVLENLKAERSGAYVIMITASSDPETVEQAMKLGASDYITKPFKIARILQAVKGAREKR